MDRTIRDKEELLQAIARSDPTYQKMLKEGAVLERKFDKMIGELDKEKSDLAWDFIMKNEDIGQYILYLACQYMEFKEIGDNEFAFSDDYQLRKRQAEMTARIIGPQKKTLLDF